MSIRSGLILVVAAGLVVSGCPGSLDDPGRFDARATDAAREAGDGATDASSEAASEAGDDAPAEASGDDAPAGD